MQHLLSLLPLALLLPLPVLLVVIPEGDLLLPLPPAVPLFVIFGQMTFSRLICLRFPFIVHGLSSVPCWR